MSIPLRLYEDAALTTQITLDGDFDNPDDESSLAGTAGETADGALWVAPDQTKLDGSIDDSETSITVAAARFADTKYSVIIIGTEKMLITAGHGTKTLTVTRGYDDTTEAEHADESAVIACYDFTSISIDCHDKTGTDESDMVTYCDDDGGGDPDGNWEAPHLISNIAHDDSEAIHRRAIVDALSTAEYKKDLLHRLTATFEEYSP